MSIFGVTGPIKIGASSIKLLILSGAVAGLKDSLVLSLTSGMVFELLRMRLCAMSVLFGLASNWYFLFHLREVAIAFLTLKGVEM